MARDPRNHTALCAFRLDAETEAALVLLETALGPGRRARSKAIRAAIREAAARVVARQQRGAR